MEYHIIFSVIVLSSMKCWDSSFFENIKYSKVDINHDGFEIVDEDAEFKPYDIKHQLLLENYFGEVIKVLLENPEENADVIEELVKFEKIYLE